MENNDFFDLSLPSQEDKHAFGADRKPKLPFKKTVTLKQILSWIEVQDYNNDIKEKLSSMVKRQPAGIMSQFFNRVDKYVDSIIINNRKKTK